MMIVRKYRERKRPKKVIRGKQKTKKDLIAEFRTEVADGNWYRSGTNHSGDLGMGSFQRKGNVGVS
jgi:hypothetical protein